MRPAQSLAVLLALLLAACTLPDSKDVDNATVSLSFATAGGVGHILLACPPQPPVHTR
jgi:hypothetical protein